MPFNRGKQCDHPLIEIDHYGERLIGCIECNQWSLLGNNDFSMALLEDDIEALRQARKPSC
jgi:hypothetical protein